jgi:hypothetical protein
MTSLTGAPSIFESFNARALPAEAVAKTFIPSEAFEKLASRSHSIVVGPRGSGKTSLFKMLQTPALEAWTHVDAVQYRSKIDFTGVFIATDISWKDQLENVGFRHLNTEEREQFSLAAFTTHVLRALIVAFLQRLEPPDLDSKSTLHRRVKLSIEQETYLVQEVAREAALTPTVHSLIALKHAATARIANLWKVAMDEKHKPKESRPQRLASIPYLNQHFLKLATFVIEVFNDLTQRPNDRWALLFDELELAPEFILTELLTSLRSIDERILIKMSMSPYSQRLDAFRKTFLGMPGHDYTDIPLWYAHKEEGYFFSRRLAAAILQEEGIRVESLEQIFGYSPFEEENEATSYAAGSIQYKAFEEAIQTDKSFRAYWQLQGIPLEDVATLEHDEKARVARKIFPTVLLRNFFRSQERKGRQRQHKRGRKNPTIYGGTTGILAVSEGNPRWLIGIVRGILAAARSNSNIPLRVQSDEMIKAAHRFRSLLKVIPVIASEPIPARSVLTIIDKVGEYFHNDTVLRDFRPQPAGSFVVDSDAPESIVKALGLALNAGAIVFVPDSKGEVLLASLRGKRFRLAYLLSPFYAIPIRLGEPASLNRILIDPENKEPKHPTLL